MYRLDPKTVISTWDWERYRFLIDAGHQQVRISMLRSVSSVNSRLTSVFLKHKAVLHRQLPENLKLAIAQQVENNLFSKARYIKSLF